MVNDSKFRCLQIQHYILFGIHLILGILSVLLPLLINKINARQPVFYDTPKWIDCINYKHEQYVNIDKNSLFNLNEIRQFCLDIKSPGAMYITSPKYVPLEAQWFIFTIFIWTAIFHLFYATIYAKRYRKLLDEDKCLRIRWFEYAFSAGIMIAIIAHLSGIQNITILYLLFKLYYVLIFSTYYNSKLPKSWFFFVGVIQLWLWIFILTQMLIHHDAKNIPWFVFFIYFGELILFNSFAVIFIIEKRKSFSVITIETLYNVLSLLSKGFLMIVLSVTLFLVSSR